MDRASQHPEFLHFRPPYRTLTHAEFPSGGATDPPKGEALVWRVRLPLRPEAFERARGRAPGVALVVILPPADLAAAAADLLRLIELCRPHSVLPEHGDPNPLDLQTLLRRAPVDLAAEILDYVSWRGLVVDHETRHVLRRTLELSGEIRTVNALARSLYVSRRALGRRCLDRGIPVPSHWLHFGRALRACLRLQAHAVSLFDVACDLGYPDGFALSNQLRRLTGLRPSAARDHLGWEWILESWLLREAEQGGFGRENASILLPRQTARAAVADAAPIPGPIPPRPVRRRKTSAIRLIQQ